MRKSPPSTRDERLSGWSPWVRHDPDGPVIRPKANVRSHLLRWPQDPKIQGPSESPAVTGMSRPSQHPRMLVRPDHPRSVVLPRKDHALWWRPSVTRGSFTGPCSIPKDLHESSSDVGRRNLLPGPPGSPVSTLRGARHQAPIEWHRLQRPSTPGPCRATRGWPCETSRRWSPSPRRAVAATGGATVPVGAPRSPSEAAGSVFPPAVSGWRSQRSRVVYHTFSEAQ